MMNQAARMIQLNTLGRERFAPDLLEGSVTTLGELRACWPAESFRIDFWRVYFVEQQEDGSVKHINIGNEVYEDPNEKKEVKPEDRIEFRAQVWSIGEEDAPYFEFATEIMDAEDDGYRTYFYFLGEPTTNERWFQTLEEAKKYLHEKIESLEEEYKNRGESNE